MFVHSWPWPPGVSLLFLLLAAAYIVVIYFREPGDIGRGVRLALAAVRIALIALLLTMMYGWMRDRYRTDLPDLVLAIDDSESMQVVDQYESADVTAELLARVQAVGFSDMNRINMAKALLLDQERNWLDQLSQRYNVKLYRIGNSARIQDSDPSQLQDSLRAIKAVQPASRLGEGVRAVLEMQRGRPTAAVVFLTDGITTDGQTIGDVADVARRRQAPLFLVGLGDDRPARDLRVEDLLVDEVVFLGDLVHCDFKIVGEGFASEKVQVRLRHQGDGSILAEQSMTLNGDGQAREMRLSHRVTEEGEFDFVVQAEALAGEANLENNRRLQTVTVRDEVIQVLLLQEYPSFEFRYLKTLLERGLSRDNQKKSIRLATVLQEADLDYVPLDETAKRVFPVGREELFEYDVLIIGDANPAYLSPSVIDNIADFVRQAGGGIVFLCGPRHMPLAYRETALAELFPIDLATAALPDEDALINQSFRAEPTRLGLASPQMQLADTRDGSLRVWRGLPAIRWLLQTPDVRPAARVLAEHPTRVGRNGQRLPVISAQFIGAGEVIFHATDESYRWSRAGERGDYYERYWLQTLRHLGRSKLLGARDEIKVTTPTSQYRRGESVPIRVRFYDERQAPADKGGVVVVVEQESGRRRRVRLQRDASRRGVFDGTVSQLPQGSYRAWLTTPSVDGVPPAATFDVLPPPGERAQLAMDTTDLEQAAKISGGRFYDLAEAHQLLDDLPSGRQVRIESLPPTSIWNSPILAGLFVGLLVMEWLVRRKVGWL